MPGTNSELREDVAQSVQLFLSRLLWWLRDADTFKLFAIRYDFALESSLQAGRSPPDPSPKSGGHVVVLSLSWVLLEMKEGTLFRFRCHTGHAYSVESLLADITEKMDDALWNSIRAFEEGELLLRYMAEHLDHGENSLSAESFLKRADDAKRRANLMRQAAMNGAEVQTPSRAPGKA